MKYPSYLVLALITNMYGTLQSMEPEPDSFNPLALLHESVNSVLLSIIPSSLIEQHPLLNPLVTISEDIHPPQRINSLATLAASAVINTKKINQQCYATFLKTVEQLPQKLQKQTKNYFIKKFGWHYPQEKFITNTQNSVRCVYNASKNALITYDPLHKQVNYFNLTRETNTLLFEIPSIVELVENNDGTLIALYTREGSLQLWNIDNIKQPVCLYISHLTHLYSLLGFTSTNNLIALSTVAPQKIFFLKENKFEEYNLSFEFYPGTLRSPDGTLYAHTNRRNIITLSHFIDTQILEQYEVLNVTPIDQDHHPDLIKSIRLLQFSPDNTILAYEEIHATDTIMDASHLLKLLDLKTKQIQTLHQAHSFFKAVHFNQDNSLIAAQCIDTTSPLVFIKHDTYSSSTMLQNKNIIAITTDGSLLVSQQISNNQNAIVLMQPLTSFKAIIQQLLRIESYTDRLPERVE